MPDTGAPWNIPYVESSDLVRDWPAISEDVADAVAAGLTASSVIKQVVSATKTDTFTTTSTSLTDITGLAATITPASTDNKVLVIVSMFVGFDRGTSDPVTSNLALVRASTVIGTNPYYTFSATRETDRTVTITYLDSPSTTSSTTYKVQGSVSTGTFTLYVNRSRAAAGSFTSTITLLEVKG